MGHLWGRRETGWPNRTPTATPPCLTPAAGLLPRELGLAAGTMVHSQQERVPKFSFTYHTGGRWRVIMMCDATVESLPGRRNKMFTTSVYEAQSGSR